MEHGGLHCAPLNHLKLELSHIVSPRGFMFSPEMGGRLS